MTCALKSFERSFKVAVIMVLTLLVNGVSAQVSNDSIQSRSILLLDDEPTASSTQQATVEWKCVNKVLTNKCLVYHNDQWFTFTPPAAGKYYLNIAVENCRDSKGVQAIVIKGNPCEVSSYRIMQCISQIQYQNSYITLDSVEANVPYLINIDGFLGDLCTFKIQYSSTPQGITINATKSHALDLSLNKNGAVSVLSWVINEPLGDSLASFDVYRDLNGKQLPLYLESIPIAMNAKGEVALHYSFKDSSGANGGRSYQVVGKFKDGTMRVMDYVQAGEHATPRNNDQFIKFLIDSRDGSSLQVVVVDELRDAVLWQHTGKFVKALDKSQSIYVGDYIAQGILHFTILVIDTKTKSKRTLRFSVGNDGKVTKR